MFLTYGRDQKQPPRIEFKWNRGEDNRLSVGILPIPPQRAGCAATIRIRCHEESLLPEPVDRALVNPLVNAQVNGAITDAHAPFKINRVGHPAPVGSGVHARRIDVQVIVACAKEIPARFHRRTKRAMLGRLEGWRTIIIFLIGPCFINLPRKRGMPNSGFF